MTPTPRTLSEADLRRLRLHSQALSGPAPTTVATDSTGHDAAATDSAVAAALAVVERLLAVQAQDYAASQWALGARSPGLTAAQVRTALDSAAIVRSWPMRGTLHLVPARDLHWMLSLTTPRLVTGAATRHAQLGLTTDVLEAARSIACGALSGQRDHTRTEFLALLESHGIATGQQRGYHLIWFLAQTGTLCWGRQAGTQQVLTLLDEWVPSPRLLHRDEALGEFVARYVAGHGPATLADFVGWSQLTLTDARIGFAVAAQRLTELSFNDVPHYIAADHDPGAGDRQHDTVLALPGFDEYFLGYRDRGALIDDAFSPRILPGKNGIFRPLLVAEGRIIGTWRTSAARGVRTVTPQPFRPLTARQRTGLARGIRSYGAFLGQPVLLGEPGTPTGLPVGLA